MAQGGGSNPDELQALDSAREFLDCENVLNLIEASKRAAAIEYAILDVVVPAIELEKQGHEIIRRISVILLRTKDFRPRVT